MAGFFEIYMYYLFGKKEEVQHFRPGREIHLDVKPYCRFVVVGI